MTKYGFIHIPKTGGTSISKFFNDNYPNHFICSRFDGKPYHSLNTSHIENPIAIVRCPFERFLSSYFYWKNGPVNGPWINKYNNHDRSHITIDEFIDYITNDSSFVNTSLTWGLHFKPQSYWIHTQDYGRTIIIRYQHNLQNSVIKLIQYLNLPAPHTALDKINISKYDNTSLALSDKTKRYIEAYYQSDLKLLHLINTRQGIFRVII